MGANIEVTKDAVIARSSKLKAIEIDCDDFVDQFMLLAMAAAFAASSFAFLSGSNELPST